MSERSRIRRFHTWVKVDGVYPGPFPCEGHRSKDRMILAIGAVKRIRPYPAARLVLVITIN